MVSPPYWIYNPFNMVEGGGMEKGKEGDDFYLKEEEWQFHYLRDQRSRLLSNK